MKLKKIIALLMAIVTVFCMTACSGNDNEPEGPQAPIEISNLTEEEIANYKSQPLVVYTNSGSGGRADWWTKKAKEAGFTNITIVNGGASAMSEKIKAERKNPQADVMCGLNAMGWADLKNEGLLLQYVPTWAPLVDEGMNDPDGYFHAITKEAILLVYDKNTWTADKAPSDWLDLWQDGNTQYHGTFQCWSALTGGTTQVNLTGILHRYKSDASDAKYGVSPEGWEQIKKLYKYGVSASGDVISAIAATDGSQKDVHCGQWYSSGIKSYSETYEVELGYVVPEVGVPYAITGCGIIKGTKNPITAALFLEWYGSTEFQTTWAKAWDTAPANSEAWEAGASEDAKMYTALPQQQIDWAWAQQHMGEWVEYITLQFMK